MEQNGKWWANSGLWALAGAILIFSLTHLIDRFATDREQNTRIQYDKERLDKLDKFTEQQIAINEDMKSVVANHQQLSHQLQDIQNELIEHERRDKLRSTQNAKRRSQ